MQTAFALGQVRGVILLAASQAEVPFEEYSALEIKRSAVGCGGAKKEQVMRMMVPFLAAGMRSETGVADPALAGAQLKPRSKTPSAAPKV